MRFAARRAQNAAWLWVYENLFLTCLAAVQEKRLLADSARERFHRQIVKRNSRAFAPNAYHTLFKLAGLAKVCARAKAKGRAL